ncbi:MAG: ABC transporter ATP-binding protein [Rhodobacteraceae bacterium]|nr:ABC transporter ATP-binding protein [Paracoccaceae bacterium]
MVKMLSTYSKLYDLLTYRERRRAGLLLLAISLAAIMDMIGIASILPFLAAVSDPAGAKSHRLLAGLYHYFNFQNDRSFLIFMGVMVLVSLLFGLAAKVLANYAISRFGHMRNDSISRRLLSAYLRQPYVWFLRHHSADLGKTVLYEVERIIMEALLPSVRLLSYAISLLFLIGLLVAVQPWVAFASAAVMGGAYALIFYVARRNLSRLGQDRAINNAERYKVAHEAIGGIKDVKLMGLESTYLERFSVPSRRVARNASISQVIGELPRHLLEVVAFGGMIALILTMLLTGSGRIGDILPTLGVFAFAGLRMFPAMQQIYLAMTQMRFVAPLLDNVHRGMAEDAHSEPLPETAQTRTERLPLTRMLDLQDIHYTYPGAETSALNGLSLSVKARSTVGIVGGSGAGKTTTVDIILGLLPCGSGKISVDGTPVTKDNLRAWQNMIGYVPQHIYLIDDTVAANIAFGIPADQIDMKAVEKAARIANLHDFVMDEMAQGYDTGVGERGVRLSGGQRQRIGIARALYHDPEVLIFDEATSALDNLTERAVMAAVNQLANSKTIILIAHRLSTVRNCDEIFLLDQGRQVAQGTFDELVQKNDSFRRMAEGVE